MDYSLLLGVHFRAPQFPTMFSGGNPFRKEGICLFMCKIDDSESNHGKFSYGPFLMYIMIRMIENFQ